VSRQVASALGVQWWRRELVLTLERVCFRNTVSRKVCRGEKEKWFGEGEEEETLLDYIPIHEITGLHPLGSGEDKLNGPSMLTKTGSHNSIASLATQGSKASTHNSSIRVIEKDPLHFELDDKDPNCVVVIDTMEDGYNLGRRTLVHFDSQEVRDSFVHQCRATIKYQTKCLAAEHNPGSFHRLQVMWIK
jgi:hypothetical protein